MEYYNSNGKAAQLITANANQLAKNIFNAKTAQAYSIALFENIANNR
jgi:hypothetical protein